MMWTENPVISAAIARLSWRMISGGWNKREQLEQRELREQFKVARSAPNIFARQHLLIIYQPKVLHLLLSLMTVLAFLLHVERAVLRWYIVVVF